MSFNRVNIATSGRSHQDLSATSYGTSDFGRINLEYYTELVPGDTAKITLSSFRRCAPLARPTNASCKEYIRAFFVPHRLHSVKPENASVSDFSFNPWITGNSDVEHPYVLLDDLRLAITYADDPNIAAIQKFDSPRILDYARFLSQLKYSEFVFNTRPSDEIAGTTDDRVSPFIARSYQLIWWYWFRDSSRIEEKFLSDYIPLTHAGVQALDEVVKWHTPRYACFRKDYFTTAFQKPQQSGSATSPNLGSTGIASYGLQVYDPNNVINNNTGSTIHPGASVNNVPVQWERAADALQHYLERNNIAGTRDIERLLARFGNTPKDAIMHIPQYLGGSSQELQIGDVTSPITMETENSTSTDSFGLIDGSLAGQLAGKGGLSHRSDTIEFHAQEFGTLMVVSYIVPSVGYYQGIPRELMRGTTNDKFDYFTPEFEGLGFQPVYAAELYQDSNISSTKVFGWQPRYSDYKHKEDTVHGDLVMKETFTGMSSFHTLRIFNDEPLNTTEFSLITPAARLALNRIFAVPGSYCQLDHFEGWCHVECHIMRPMRDEALPELENDNQKGKSVQIEYGGTRM